MTMHLATARLQACACPSTSGRNANPALAAFAATSRRRSFAGCRPAINNVPSMRRRSLTVIAPSALAQAGPGTDVGPAKEEAVTKAAAAEARVASVSLEEVRRVVEVSEIGSLPGNAAAGASRSRSKCGWLSLFPRSLTRSSRIAKRWSDPLEAPDPEYANGWAIDEPIAKLGPFLSSGLARFEPMSVLRTRHFVCAIPYHAFISTRNATAFHGHATSRACTASVNSPPSRCCTRPSHPFLPPTAPHSRPMLPSATPISVTVWASAIPSSSLRQTKSLAPAARRSGPCWSS